MILVSAKMAYTDEMKRDTTMASMQFRRPMGGHHGTTTNQLTGIELSSVSGTMEPVEVNIRLRSPHSETSSKPHSSTVADVKSSPGNFSLSAEAIVSGVY